MVKLILRWISLSVAIWVASLLLSDHLQIKGDWLTFAGIAFIFGLLNAIVGPIAKLLTLPLTVLSLGVWLLALNGLLLVITDKLSDSLTITNWGWAIVADVVISLVASLLNKVADRLR